MVQIKKRWMGIDPGLAIIGWSVLEETGDHIPKIVDYGVIETSKKYSTPRRLLEIEQDMIELIWEFTPDATAMEMPFFNRQIKAAGGVIQAVGVINLVIYRMLKQEPIFLHQASWKAHLGNGRADKKEVAQLLQILFDLQTLPIDDSLDAIGIAYAGLSGLRNDIH
ncbi:MAG: crossover junction endodeoxyribonuclease RuvC [Microcystaceae cyanobacterium]